MKRFYLYLTLIVCFVFSIQALTPYRPARLTGEKQMFPAATAVLAAAGQASDVTVVPAPGDVQSLMSFDITFSGATEVTRGDVGYGNAPYVCEKGSSTRNFCFTITTAGNVLTVATSSELTAPGKYELHLPAGFYNIDGNASTEELVFDYTIVAGQTLNVTVVPAPGDVQSLKTIDVTFSGATEVTIVNPFDFVPYICEKGSSTKDYCGGMVASGNVLTVTLGQTLQTPGKNYELHVPAGLCTIDGSAMTEDLVFDYTIVETLSDGILRDAPAGRKVECMTRFASFFPDYGGEKLWCWPILGKPTHYIVGEDGNLYIYNPIVTAPFANKPIMSYIKAENIDGRYIAKFPQAIFEENFNGNDEIMYLNLAKNTEEAYQIVESENNQVEFVIENDVLKARIPAGEKLGDYALGSFTAEGVWSYYANYEMWYEPFTDTAATPPADGVIKDYVMSYSVDGQNSEANVSIIINDDEIWIKGIAQNYIPDAWAHGEIEGDKVYFDKYLGYSESVGQYAYLFSCGLDEANNGLKDLVFNYNPSLNTLSLIGYELVVNPNPWMYYALQRYGNPVIKPAEETILTTKTPKPIQGFDAFYPQSGDQVAVQIRISTENTAGESMSANNLFYEFLRNDESVYTFTPDNYPELTESLSLIPVNYQRTGVIMISGVARTFNAYLAPEEQNLGARMVYRDETGTYYSETVWAKPHSGIDGTISDQQCVSVEYFDISGREIQNPANGMYIMKEIFANGDVKISKIFR